MRIKYKEIVEKEMEQLPCIDCGFDGKLEFWQDRSYYTVTITCPGCKKEVRGETSSLDSPQSELISKCWNPNNDRNEHIKKIQATLDNLPKLKSDLIDKLSALKKGLFNNQIDKK